MWGCIYLLNNELGEAYIGSSLDWERRLSEHRKTKTINMKCLWYWDFLEEGEYASVEELRKKEQKYIRDNKDCLVNKYTYPLDYKQYTLDYYKKNQEVIKEKSTQYRKKNPNKVKSALKKWRDENKETISEYNKKYKEANKERTAEYNKQYREKQKNKINL